VDRVAVGTRWNALEPICTDSSTPPPAPSCAPVPTGRLVEAARSAARTKGSYFGAQYRQIAKRRGPNKAAVAVAHSLCDLIWHMFSTGECFHDLQRRRDPERETRRLVSQLEQLGFHVALTTPQDPAA